MNIQTQFEARQARCLRWVLVLGLLSLIGCGESEEDSSFPLHDNTAEVEAYYADNPDFFVFSSIDQLPANLNWQNGGHLPDIGSPEAVKGGTQYSRLTDFPRTFRTVGPDSNGSFRPWLLDSNTVTLAHRHPDEFEYYPGLANEWAVDRENKTIYVRLEPTATWSDGVPVTSNDFLFMFFFFRSEYIVAPWYNNWYSSQYTKITRFDDHTFAISIPEAKPDMDSRVLELRPVPQHFFKELGDDYVERYQWRFTPVTGPYVIHDDDVDKGRSVVVTRNKDWWAKDRKFFRYRYNPDRVQLTVIRENAKVFEAFKRGEIDQFGLNLAEYWYEKLPNEDPDVQNGYIHKVQFYNQRPRPTYGLWINTSKPLLKNRDIRVGVNYATNWDLVIEKYFRGDYERMETSSDGYGEFSHPTLKARSFDVEKALQAFARAGFSERGGDGILKNASGQRLAFTLSTGYESLKDVPTILKEEAQKAGLEFRIEVLDGTAGWKKVQEKKHDLHFSAFGVSLEMYPRFWETYHSVNAYDVPFLDDGSDNPDRGVKTQTNNLEALALMDMDTMIDAYRASDDKTEMIDLAHRMTALHHEHASFVPGYKQRFYRVGFWRWVRYPEFFNHKHSSSSGSYFVHWLDPALKEETMAARDSGDSWPPGIRVYDQHR
ncbi:MAG: extracellular solute-binding protein [Pseudomonadota bacterium]